MKNDSENNKVFAAATIAAILGLYAGAVFNFSEPATIGIDPATAQKDPEVAERRILDVVRVQESSLQQTNLPVPGADCDVNSYNLGEDNSFDEETAECFTSLAR